MTVFKNMLFTAYLVTLLPLVVLGLALALLAGALRGGWKMGALLLDWMVEDDDQRSARKVVEILSQGLGQGRR